MRALAPAPVPGLAHGRRPIPSPRRAPPAPRAASADAAVDTAGLVFGPAPGSWDAGGLGQPVVRCYVGDNEQRWLMWYSASPAPPTGALAAVATGAGAAGVATSPDGVAWTRCPSSPVLSPSDDWWTHDTAAVAVSDVQILSSGGVAGRGGGGVYWMLYQGACWEAAPPPAGLDARLEAGVPVESLRTRPGLALSQDGRHWARVEADHHTGALLDAGAAGAWDAHFIASPQLVAAGPRDLRMYYHSFDAASAKWTVGVALSDDGLKWERGAPVFAGGGRHPFDAAGAAARHVVQDPSTGEWVMFYEGVDAATGDTAVGVAVSRDGLSGWRASAAAPVLAAAASPSAWDGGCVGAPCAVPMAGGAWRLYYGGRARGAPRGAWCGVGLALGEEGAGGGGLAGVAWKRRGREAPEGVVARRL